MHYLSLARMKDTNNLLITGTAQTQIYLQSKPSQQVKLLYVTGGNKTEEIKCFLYDIEKVYYHV